MYLYKQIILILILSVSFAQKNSISDTNVKVTNKSTSDNVQFDPMKVWEKDDDNIANPELKMQLEQLRREFATKRTGIQDAYKTKIKALKEQSHTEIESLKKGFMAKRNALKEKYGVKKDAKPKKLKGDKKNKVKPINKPKLYNTPKGVKPVKEPTPSKDLDDDNSKAKPEKVVPKVKK